jgi:hypothetical protein
MPQAAGDDRLDADPEPAISLAADRAIEPEPHEDDGEHHDHPVDEHPPPQHRPRGDASQPRMMMVMNWIERKKLNS